MNTLGPTLHRTVAVSFLFLAVFAQTAAAETTTTNGIVWHYDIFGAGNRRYAVITGADDLPEEVEIPSKFGGIPVTTIGANAFEDENITRVRIPGSVKTIRDEAFRDTSLEIVEFSEGLRSLESGWATFDFNCGPFLDCWGLKSAILPNSITNIGPGVFQFCTSLTNDIVIGLGELTEENAVTIGDYAFEGVASRSLVLGDRVTNIGWNNGPAFCGIEWTLESISLGRNIVFQSDHEGGTPFASSDNLTNAVISSTIAHWPDFFFSDCTNLATVVLLDGMTSIGNSMFMNCPALENVTIPSTVTNIGEAAFKYTGYGFRSETGSQPIHYLPSRLATVKIPASVQTIGTNAFEGCDAMETLYIEADSPISDVTLRNDCKLVSTCRIVRGDLPPDDPQIVTEFLPPATEYFHYWAEVRIAGGEEPFSWSLENAPDGVEIDDSGVLWGYPEEPGTHEFAVVVEDAAGRTARRTLSLVVHEDDGEPPVFASITPEATRFRIDPGETVSFEVSVYDPDGDDVSLSWNWCNKDDSNWQSGGNGETFLFAPETNGLHVIEVVASDGLHEQQFSWEVLVQEKKPLAITTGATLPDALTEKSYWQPVEAAGGEWPYTWEIVDPDEWPGWLGSYYIEHWEDSGYDYPCLSSDWYPSEDNIGTYSFSIRVTDADGSNAVKRFTLEVKDNPNPPPVIDKTSPVYAVRVEPGTSRTFMVEAHDRKGDALSYSWGRYGEEVPGATGSSWTFEPTDADKGSFELFCRVSDGVNEASAYWWVVVGYAKTVYVDAASTADDPDGTSWATAYPTLGDARGDLEIGDTVLVAPGMYECPWLPDGIELRSRDGAATAFLDAVPGGEALCVDGFTFRGIRYTYPAAGPNAVVPWGSTLVGCILSDCSSEGILLSGCNLQDCVVSGCSSERDLLEECNLRDCIVSGCSGGENILWNCDLENCVVSGNRSEWDVIRDSRLWNCSIAGNTAGEYCYALSVDCTAWNSIVSGNVDSWGEPECNFDARPYADGTLEMTALTNCCAPGLERIEAYVGAEGHVVDFAAQGCIEADPKFVDAANGDCRLRAGSPCIDAGAAAFVRGETDVAGNARVQGAAVDLGAYEGEVEGFVISVIVAGAGAVSPMTAVVDAGGSATFAVDASAGRPFLGWTADGVAAGNATTYTWENVQADGELAATFGALAFCVDAATGDDANDGFSWSSPKATVQAAVDVAVDGESVAVKPGVYGPIDSAGKDIRIESTDGAAATIIDGGGTNRCAYLGPRAGQGSTLSGFTLRNGNASWDDKRKSGQGGGAYGGTLLDCDVVGNRANDEGGGLVESVAHRCRIVGNAVDVGGVWAYGGGAHWSDLYNCLVASNSVSVAVGTQATWAYACGGGVAYCSLYQCTIVDNSAKIIGDTTNVDATVRGGGSLCSFVGAGNIVYGNTADGVPSDVEDWDGPSDAAGSLVGVDPKFVDRANGNHRLREDSPAVDVGATDVEEWRAASTTDTDLDGNPRVRGRCIDLGCYESAWTVDRTETVTTPDPVPYAWLDGYRLDTSEGYEIAASVLSSNEVNTVWQCYVAGLDPTNAASKFQTRISFDGVGDPVVTWMPDLGAARAYAVEGAKQLGEDWDELETDADWDADGYRFFRVKVSLP